MKANPSLLRNSPLRSGVHWLAALALGATLLVSGCVTDDQVRTIVATSNAAMLTGQLGEPATKPGDTPAAAWQDANASVEAFIAAHPDQPEVIAPLRIRQAMLLLAQGQTSLAQAAFESADAAHLHTDRDEALKRQQEHLLWWFGTSSADTWSEADQTAAAEARASLKTEYARLERSPEIRDYLAEMCAWIGLAAAKQTTSEQTRRERLEEALDEYATIFTTADFEILQKGAENLAGPKSLTTDVRRRLRGRVLLEEARQYNLGNAIGAHPRNTTFDAIINKPTTR